MCVCAHNRLDHHQMGGANLVVSPCGGDLSIVRASMLTALAATACVLLLLWMDHQEWTLTWQWPPEVLQPRKTQN